MNDETKIQDKLKVARNMQFLRVQREDDEDTWISGEELKTEGSSDTNSEMDEKAQRRKVVSKKARRRKRSTSSNSESSLRFSLPNLSGDNKSGIVGFSLSKPNDERFSIASGEITKPDIEKLGYIESGLERMRTENSLDQASGSVDVCALTDAEIRWRPKRGSLKLPNLDEAQFPCEKENYKMYENPSNRTPLPILKNGVSKVPRENRNLKVNFQIENLDRGDNMFIDENDDDCVENFVENYKFEKLKLPTFRGDVGDIDTSVQSFINEMNGFYEEMSVKLKTLRDCPVLDSSHNVMSTNLMDEKFEIFDQKTTDKLNSNPKMKRTLGVITKMDKEISQTISDFKEEREKRLNIQREMLQKIPRNYDSKFFIQMCDFERNSSENQKPKENLRNPNPAMKNKRMKNKTNFIEQNIELAKLGMNFSLTDEQKQRLERLLRDETKKNEKCEGQIPSGVMRVNNLPEEITSSYENPYENCTLNAFRLSDEHKEKLIKIDKALENFHDESESKNSEISVNLVKSLKEIDDKLEKLNAAYKKDEECLEKLKLGQCLEVDIEKIEEEVIQKRDEN